MSGKTERIQSVEGNRTEERYAASALSDNNRVLPIAKSLLS